LLLALVVAGCALASWWVGGRGDDAPHAVDAAQARSDSFPWHRAPASAEASAPALPAGEQGGLGGVAAAHAGEGGSAPSREASAELLPGAARALALSQMRKGQFSTAWAYLQARGRCLSVEWEDPDMSCSPAARARDDAAALALLEAGAGRCLPEAELVLAEWWVHEFARLRLMISSVAAAGGADPASLQPVPAEWRTDAQHARERALTTLARAALHNADAATRLEELRTAWASLD
jgi:hypothetical protein